MATHRLELIERFEEAIWIENGELHMQGPANKVVNAYAASGH
jgi:ABC-type polysaccharide/polyol phosphate transport system ATPase subunit